MIKLGVSPPQGEETHIKKYYKRALLKVTKRFEVRDLVSLLLNGNQCSRQE